MLQLSALSTLSALSALFTLSALSALFTLSALSALSALCPFVACVPEVVDEVCIRSHDLTISNLQFRIFPIWNSIRAASVSKERQTLGLHADRIADRERLQLATCRSALFRELGIATQRSIARDIIERSGRFPEHAQRS
jgi:hypothetical protein